MRNFPKFWLLPVREYLIIGSVSVTLLFAFAYPGISPVVLFFSLIGSVPILIDSFRSILRRKITIDTFNLFALGVSFFSHDVRSAAFIVLMLSFARFLEWKTSSQTHNAVEELLKLKPLVAYRVKGEGDEEIPVEKIKSGDILIVKSGQRIAVDGIIVSGSGFINESSVTGESVPIEKIIGDELLSSTLVETGGFKMKATRVGKDSTLERMAELIREASRYKSHTEKLADRFASIFLPLVLLLGAVTYIITRNIEMTAALFLVACADDMAVAIPLAVTASLGHAAKRGVIIKGGQWLDCLARVKTIVLDKTGTLTYGNFVVQNISIVQDVSEKQFWEALALAEKYSEHPIGRALFYEAQKKSTSLPDPEKTNVLRGAGIEVFFGSHHIIVGNEKIFPLLSSREARLAEEALQKYVGVLRNTAVVVCIDGKYSGVVSVADTPRAEAQESIATLKRIGIEKVIMFTGDNEVIAQDVSTRLGIDEWHASMTPEEKVSNIESLAKTSSVAMIGDGINDAPSLARADVGIAMGGGTSVSVQAADVIILNDKLSRIPEMVQLGRKTRSVIHADIAIWIVTNCFGFALVFAGIATPAIAAFYNFISDFFPLINSARLFSFKKSGK